MRFEHTVGLVLIFVAGCTSTGPARGPLSECDSDDGSYTEVDGTWVYTMDGVDTGNWRLGVRYLDLGTYGDLSMYGCVIEGGVQLYEYSGSLSAMPGVADQAVSPGASSAASGRFQAGLNRNLAGDHDTFIVMGGDSGSGTVNEFDPAAGVTRGTLTMTARPLAMVEHDDTPSPITIDFDLTWAP